MALLREWLARLWGTLGGRRADADLQAELRSHLELAADAAPSPPFSSYQATTRAMDALRDQRAVPWLDDLGRDVRHGVRLLRADPIFTAVAVLSLALGIGLNSAIFSLSDVLLLRPLPVPDAGRVMSVSADGSEEWFSGGGVSYPNYRDLRDAARSFDALVAYRISTVAFAPSADAPREMRMGMLVSDNFFTGLGVQPSLGRAFSADETAAAGRAAVIVLSDDFWRAGFNADPLVLGRVVWLNGVECHVIGVASAAFTGLVPPLRPAFYAPAVMASRLGVAMTDPLLDRGAPVFGLKGRLHPGVSRSTAQAELRTIWAGLARAFPKEDAHRTPAVRTELEERVRSDPWDAAVMSIFGALAVLVLIIACANVANLMLGRVRARAREMAVRLSLGVSRSRLLRQLLTEGLVLSCVACAAGMAIAYGGVRFFQTIPTGPQVIIDPHIDERVVIFSLLVAVASATLCSILPARLSIGTDLVSALKTAETNRTHGRTIGRNILVIAQVAAATVVLVATGMMLDGFRKALTLNPGFRTDRLAFLSLDPSLVRYTPERTRTFYRELVDRARNIPGVRSATLTSAVPFLINNQEADELVPEGYQFPAGHDSISTFVAAVDEQYFQTMQVAMRRGRAFTSADTATSRGVVIVNEEFAKEYWPGQDPIGKRLRVADKSDQWLEVVGVTRTGKYVWIGEAPTPFAYFPLAQQSRTRMSLLVESASPDATPLLAPMRSLVTALDVSQPIANAQTYAQLYRERAIVVPRIIMETVAAIALLALVLALIGVYGLVAYSVSRRTREIGIRMAIGAAKSDVLSMVLRQGLVLSVAGIAAGGVVSIIVARLMAAALVGVGAPNPATYVIVPVALIAMTALASYIPGRRASLVDPLVALRCE